MLSWALTFLVLAIIAGVLGMGVVEGMAANIAWVLFVVFIILFLVGLVTGPQAAGGLARHGIGRARF